MRSSLAEIGIKDGYWIHDNGMVEFPDGSMRKGSPQGPKRWLTVKLPLKAGGVRAYQVHRLVAMAFIPNPDDRRYVAFRDKDLNNTHVSNLFWKASFR